MNYIKTTVKAEDYVKVQPFGGKYIVRMLPEENGDGTITCVECMTSEYPDEDRITELETEYGVIAKGKRTAVRMAEIRRTLSDDAVMIEAIERMVAQNGVTEDDRNAARVRVALRDELGKLVQTVEGDGSDMNPYKWAEGDAVVAGMWYRCPGGYIWEAVKNGVPTSEVDREYFDVVGI